MINLGNLNLTSQPKKEKKAYSQENNERSTYKATLCWDCQNAYANKCSWFVNYTPVDGWTAKQTFINYKGKNSEELTSYLVMNCPNFIADVPRKAKKGGKLDV